MKTETITITDIKRIGRSGSGNAQYAITDEHGITRKTGKDSACVYSIVDGRVDVRAALQIDGRGSIRGFEYLTD